VGCDERQAAGLPERFDPPVDAASPVFVHRVERLVQDRRSRCSDPGGGEENPTALASGQLADGEIGGVLKIRFVQHLVDLLRRLRSQAADETQNLADRRERRHVGFLGNEREVGTGRDFSPPQIGTVHEDSPGVRSLHSGRELQQRRLAGAVLTGEQGHSASDLQVQIAEDPGPVVVSEGDAFHVEASRHDSASRAASNRRSR